MLCSRLIVRDLSANSSCWSNKAAIAFLMARYSPLACTVISTLRISLSASPGRGVWVASRTVTLASWKNRCVSTATFSNASNTDRAGSSDTRCSVVPVGCTAKRSRKRVSCKRSSVFVCDNEATLQDNAATTSPTANSVTMRM